MAQKVKNKFKAAQNFVPIESIRDGVVTLKDKTLRAVVMTSTINFALKSSDEQLAILSQFQNFLNSLEFSIQIFVQSRDLDIRPYIVSLEEIYKKQTTDLMRIQTREYIGFIQRFVDDTSIMVKRFFIVIPYSPTKPSIGKKGKATTEEKSANFEEQRSQLEQRISVVKQGLSRTGIKAVSLGTEEMIELYYKMFNPGEMSKHIPLGEEEKEK